MRGTEAERAVIASIIVKPDCIFTVTDIISGNDFSSKTLGEIFNSVLDLQQDGIPIDYISVLARLKDRAIQLDPSELLAIVKEYVTSANVGYHAGLIRDMATRRRLRDFGARMAAEAATGVELEAFIAEKEQGLVEIAAGTAGRRPSDVPTIIREIRDSRAKGIRYVPNPPYLEGAIPGAFGGHIWVVGGYTSVGKSAWINQLSVDFLQDQAAIVEFSLEDTRQSKVIKLVANLSDVPQGSILSGHISGVESQIAQAESEVASWRLNIYDDVRTVDAIRNVTKKHCLRKECDIVIIDFVQNLAGSGSLYERMSDAAVRLQAMALEMDITVIALSQIDNASAREDNGLLGFKGAGELAAVADIGIWLKRVPGEGNEKLLDCQIRKNRPFGEVGVIAMEFSERWTRVRRRYS